MMAAFNYFTASLALILTAFTTAQGQNHHDKHAFHSPKLYDYIVVGGGAAGMPLAYTLAEDGDAHVLVLERGGRREENQETTTIEGWGTGLLNNDITEEVITMEGVVSHLGRVLSGGTALSAGVYIEEEPRYFDALRTEGADLDQGLVDDAYVWVREQVATPMDFAEPYGSAWAKSNEEVGYSPLVGTRAQLIEGSWNTLSLFLNDDGVMASTRERLASDVLAQGMLSKRKNVPNGLEIKTRVTVIRVEFDTSYKGKPRATCVQFVKSPNEAKRIDSRVSSLSLEDKYDDTEEEAEHKQEVMRACIRPAGEIFLSAGAVNTPVVLMKSGVGPRDAVEKAMKGRGEKGGMVLEISELGKNLHDRNWTPLATFFDAPLPEPDGFKITSVQVGGVSRVGEGCSGSSGKRLDFNIFDSSPDCGWAASEEFSGGKSIESLVFATRLILPPYLRSSPEADLLVRVLQKCSSGFDESPLCLPLIPTITCIQKLVAMISFPSVPKGRGYVTINEKGEPIVSGGYNNDPDGEDLHVAVEGLKRMIRMIGTSNFDGILQKNGPLACPFLVFNSFLSLLLIGARNVPGADSDELLDTAAVIRSVQPDYPTHPPSMWEFLGDAPADKRRALEEAPLPDLVKQELDVVRQLRPDGLDEWRGVQSELATFLTGGLKSIADLLSAPDDDKAEGDVGCGVWQPCTEEYLEEVQLRRARRFAIFPPLPIDMSRSGLETYVKAHGSSLWHFAGSAPMGTVVDNDFRVYGIDNLAICDASVLPQVTRMNPQGTVMMLGRYAGVLRKQERKKKQHYGL